MVNPSASAFQCPGCGAGLTVRAPGFSEAIVCSHCGSTLDAQDPQHQRLEQYARARGIEPTLPLGRRGTLRGVEYEVLGFMERTVRYHGVDYSWNEYLLYNPYQGSRWLLESNGHWTLLKTLPGGPGS